MKDKKENILKEEGKETHKPEGLAPKVETVVQPKMRQIVIETDGASIHLIKSETAGILELTAILQKLILFINKEK